MSDEGYNKEALERSKRAVLRTIKSTVLTINATLEENPSIEMVHAIGSLLDSWKEDLGKLSDIDSSLLELLEEEKLAADKLAKHEAEISAQYIDSRRQFNLARGKLLAIRERLHQSSPLRQSLNSSVTIASTDSSSHPSVKLPDIPVPKFNGNISNFTEWFALFNATIHRNERLSDIQKLYFLRQAMTEQAADVLKDYPIDDKIYPEAYKHVEERFFNKRVIISNHFSELVDLPVVTNATIRQTLDKVSAIVRGLKVCNIDTSKMSPMFAFLVVRKLPDRIRTEWETSNKDYSMYPSFDQLSTFLSERCFAFETSNKSHASTSKSISAQEKPKTKTTLAISDRRNNSESPDQRSCILCQRNHFLSSCSSFLAKSIPERTSFVVQNRLCKNCLRRGHRVDVCRSSKCRSCGGPHNTSLHDSSLADRSTTVTNPTPSTSQEITKTTMAVVSPKSGVVLLPSAVVNVRVGNKKIPARALIDICSQANLVSEQFVRNNRIVSKKSSTVLYSVSPTGLPALETVSLTVTSRINDFKLTFDADVVGKIPYEIGSEIIEYVQRLDPGLELADCALQSPHVDILIGAQFANRILSGNKQFIGELCIEQTPFGWIAAGPLNNSRANDIRCCHLTVSINNALTRFWEVEEVNPPKLIKSDHELCENHFALTHARLSDGRFQVRLPFKSDSKSLANTYSQARSALLRYESKSVEPLRCMYVDFMKEYRNLGHMKLAENLSNLYFIPHLPVYRPESSTTQLRVVFNASARNATGISLNQALLNGPVLQRDLFDILITFRSYLIAFSADISKMYRQITVHPDDQPYQSILWRDNPTEKIEAYHLTTLTYGTTPAAYIATKCLQEISKDIKPQKPEIATAIEDEFYMDDLLSGANTPEEAREKATGIHSALMDAKFPLRKYVSNSAEFLTAFEPDLIEKLRQVSFSSTGAAKILGLRWLPSEDEFRINVKLAEISNITLSKRAIASLIAGIYDPLGIVAPVTIIGKILLQDLWREELSWDDPVPVELKRKFINFYNDLENLPQFSIPRPYSATKADKIDIIGFSDASNRAYGATVYIRAHIQGTIKSIIVCAKTRVAPLKAITIPRLELLGALLLTKLLVRVANTLNYEIADVRAFCDSTIVLAWLKSPSSKFEVFIRNRIEVITATLKVNQWSYVKTNENPADLLTRGIPVKSLIGNALWLHGPDWMQLEQLTNVEIPLPDELPEIRSSKVSLAIGKSSHEKLVSKFSNFDKLVRAIMLLKARLRRQTCNDAPVTRTDAMLVICRETQAAWFSAELSALKKGQPISNRSALSSLNPFLDNEGVLRVGGRLQNTLLSYDAKHPIIVHAKSAFAALFIRHVHERYFHASRSFTLAHVQAKFWVVGGAAKLVKRTVNLCVLCARIKGEVVSQIMGSLPADRTVVSRPFACTGVDFAGPFTVKCTNHRSPKHLKHYAAFFVCMTTRAVHIESVADLSTNAFIAALQRFIARRGVPNTIWSDNGMNFVGAKNVIENHCASLGIAWKFIPPRSPHHGGIWESAVKAGKKHLLAVTRGSVFNEDQLKTTLATIEAIMNSRPLYRRNNANDLEAIDILTPGHFLTGSNLLEPPTLERNTLALNDRLNFQKQIIEAFWSSWRKSYIAMLQTRSKWKFPKPNISVGDIVLLKENCAPISWPLARVVRVQPDAEGIVRIVSVKARNSEFQRAVQQIAKLPVESGVQDP